MAPAVKEGMGIEVLNVPFAEWDQWGWHRVTYYGDLREPVHALADALGWKVHEEA